MISAINLTMDAKTSPKKKKATSEWGLCQFFTRNEYPEAKIFKVFICLPTQYSGKKKKN